MERLEKDTAAPRRVERPPLSAERPSSPPQLLANTLDSHHQPSGCISTPHAGELIEAVGFIIAKQIQERKSPPLLLRRPAAPPLTTLPATPSPKPPPPDAALADGAGEDESPPTLSPRRSALAPLSCASAAARRQLFPETLAQLAEANEASFSDSEDGDASVDYSSEATTTANDDEDDGGSISSDLAEGAAEPAEPLRLLLDEVMHPLPMPYPTRAAAGGAKGWGGAYEPCELYTTLAPPTAAQVQSFIHELARRLGAGAEVNLVGLAYVERLVSRTGRSLTPRTWRRACLTAWLLAAKMWDDECYENVDASAALGVELGELATLEGGVASAIGYEMSLTPAEYAHYYYSIRSMCQLEASRYPLRPLNEAIADRLVKMSTAPIISWPGPFDQMRRSL